MRPSFYAQPAQALKFVMRLSSGPERRSIRPQDLPSVLPGTEADYQDSGGPFSLRRPGQSQAAFPARLGGEAVPIRVYTHKLLRPVRLAAGLRIDHFLLGARPGQASSHILFYAFTIIIAPLSHPSKPAWL